jgi:hypothetical protein
MLGQTFSKTEHISAFRLLEFCPKRKPRQQAGFSNIIALLESTGGVIQGIQAQ